MHSRLPMPDIVVLLPGITGSVLQRDGEDIWAPTASALLRGVVSFGRSVRRLSLATEDDDWQVDDLGDGVTAPSLVPDVHLLPGFWKIDGYSAIERFLLDNFELDRGRNYFPFPYDWRRDNRASARRLRDDTRDWLKAWRDGPGRRDAQLILVCHSMGGLVARYFVEALEGWPDTRAVVTFGTPFYGSLNAPYFLVEGFSEGLGPVRADLTPLLRSCTSVHQLVPVYRCVHRDGTATTPRKAGLPGWRPSWDEHLAEFHAEMESAAARNREHPGFARNPVVYRPIVGTDQPTRQSIVATGDRVTFEMDRDGNDEGGDGTVPLLSAALSGTEDMRTFAPQRHARLQNHSPMLDHLRSALGALYRPRIDDLRSLVTTWFSYEGADVYLPGEPCVVRIRANVSLTEELLPTVPATVRIRDAGGVREPAVRTVDLSRQWQQVDLGPLEPGTYRIEVTGRSDAASLSDVFAVAAPEEFD